MSEKPRELAALIMIVAQLLNTEVKRGHREQANHYAAQMRNIVDRFLEAKEGSVVVNEAR